MPYAGASTPTGSVSGSVAGPGSVPYSVYAQQQGDPNLQNFQPPSTASPQPTVSPTPSAGGSGVIGGGTVLLLVLVLVAAVVVVIVARLVEEARSKEVFLSIAMAKDEKE